MNIAEETFYLHLKDPDSMKFIFMEQITLDALPTEGLHPAFLFAKNYFFESGMTVAPGPDVFETEMGDRLKDFDLDIHQDPEETIDWAIKRLKSQAVYSQSSVWIKEFANRLVSAVDTDERIEILAEESTALLELVQDAQSQSSKVDVRDATDLAFAEYLERAGSGVSFRGMSTGLDALDDHMGGIWPGELAIVAAGAKVGKSFFLANAALHNWRAGRPVCLFTLENSTAMTVERIACMAAGVDSRLWQRGSLGPRELERVEEWITALKGSEVPFWILQPDLGERSFEAMVAEARIRGAEALFIDQLTFVELGGSARQAKHERIGNALHNLKGMISTGNRISCTLAHQINREGVKAAQKSGYLEMYHLADASETERTADWVIGLHASADDRQVNQIRLQILAARREENRNWQVNWQVANGNISIIREIMDMENQ